jgi:hypothetical protein
MNHRAIKILLAAFIVISTSFCQAQLITNFGATASNGGAWTYTPGTSTISGNEGPGDLIFGTPAFGDYTGSTQFTLTGTVISAPSAGFTVLLEDSTGDTATALFDWADFIGGATISSTFTPVGGFDISDVINWNLVSGGSGEAVNATFSSLSATTIPEPSTYALMGLGLAGLLIYRRRKVVA